MVKLKVQAQQLQPGDIVGSGEIVHSLIISSVRWPSNKVCVNFSKNGEDSRSAIWGKYTMINIERPDKEELPSVSRASHYS